MKKIKKDDLETWFQKLSSTPMGYKLKGKDFESITKRMTREQLALAISLTAAAYSCGCEDTRQWARERARAEFL